MTESQIRVLIKVAQDRMKYLQEEIDDASLPIARRDRATNTLERVKRDLRDSKLEYLLDETF